MADLVFKDSSIVIRRGDQEAIFQLGDLPALEGRLNDIQRTNSTTAPGLLADFNRGFLAASRMEASVTSLRANAAKALQDERSRLLLDEVEKILKEKQIRPSIEMREAVLGTFTSYSSLQEYVDVLSTLQVFFRDKKKAFEMGFHGVRRLVGDGPGVRWGSGLGLYGGTTGSPPDNDYGEGFGAPRGG